MTYNLPHFNLDLKPFLSIFVLKPIRPSLFSCSPGTGDAKNQNYHQMIEIKFCVSYYSHKSMPDAKFESDSFSTFGDMMSQISPSGREQVIKLGYLPPENGFNLKKMSFLSRIVLLDPKLTPMLILAISKQRKIFSFSKSFRCFDEKRAAAPPLIE